MSKPTGDSLHPREHGFWDQCPLPALIGALIALVALTILATAPGAQATAVPRIVPPDAVNQPGSPNLKGLVPANESSRTGQWIVAGKPGRRTERQARRFGATAISHPLGIYALAEEPATGFILALRNIGVYRFSEPDVPSVSSIGTVEDPGERTTDQWWLNEICPVQNRNCRAPAVTGESPTMALLEESLDSGHPDLAELREDNRLLGAISLGDERDLRGTAMAALAASPSGDRDGRVTGVWPGMRVRLVPSDGGCVGKTRAVYRAAERNLGNRVLLMGYSFPPGQSCYSHYLATEYAVYRGMIPVAAAGDAEGSVTNPSPPQPAGDRHVLTVTASNQDDDVWDGAIGGAWVDLTAPGEGLRVAWLNSVGDVQQRLWDWSIRTSTGYSATIVAAAAAWLLQERPDLKARQVMRLMTNTARDLGPAGRDPSSGHGLLNLARALREAREAAPVNDPFEPNDDIGWVTHKKSNSLLQTGLGSKDKQIKRKPFWRPSQGNKEVVATLGRTKDPVDVYRIQMAPKTKVLITVTANGRTNLVGIRSDATSVTETTEDQKLAEAIDRPEKETYAMQVGNPASLPRTAFVAIGVSSKQAGENFSYRLSVKPRR